MHEPTLTCIIQQLIVNVRLLDRVAAGAEWAATGSSAKTPLPAWKSAITQRVVKLAGRIILLFGAGKPVNVKVGTPPPPPILPSITARQEDVHVYQGA